MININEIKEAVAEYHNSVEPFVNRKNAHDIAQEFTEVGPQNTESKIQDTRRINVLNELNYEPFEFAFERSIGNNDNVYSNYVELMLDAKKKVGRIEIRNGTKLLGYATGFLVSPRLIMTNWHVFRNKEEVNTSTIKFGYELDLKGNGQDGIEFELLADDFFFSYKDLDYCLVAVKPVDKAGTIQLTNFGYLYLDSTVGKANEDEYVTVVHHPSGDYMQIALRENKLVKKMPQTLWYQSDTSPGSSGAAVFNDQWQVIALHSRGVPEEKDGGYLSRNGKDIIRPNAKGEVDGSQIKWIANAGFRVSKILEHFFSLHVGNPLAEEIKLPPNKKITQEFISTNTKETQNIHQQYKPMENSNLVSISFPASMADATGSVTVTIKKDNATGAPQQLVAKTEAIDELLAIENAKPVPDYEKRNGYNTKFLEVEIPLPVPNKSIRNKIAKIIGTNSIELKYYNFSIIQHKVRCLPLVTCINIDGNLDQNIPRKETKNDSDKWVIDPRINEDEQVSQWFYSGSGFDRGHMVTREHAGWGKTRKQALLANNDTFHFTNCTPQHKDLNQEEWQKLEDFILNKEKGKMRDMKTSVFTGPIFDEGDPAMRGIQIPMAYYKIVAWVRDNGSLAATGFKMTQNEFVEGMEFEDFDFSTGFVDSQIAIADIEKLIKVSFGPLADADTFEKQND